MATLLFRYRPPAPAHQNTLHPVAAHMASADEPGEFEGDDSKRDRWWYESSYDLRSGLEVDDSVGQTIPGEVIDQLFKR